MAGRGRYLFKPKIHHLQNRLSYEAQILLAVLGTQLQIVISVLVRCTSKPKSPNGGKIYEHHDGR